MNFKDRLLIFLKELGNMLINIVIPFVCFITAIAIIAHIPWPWIQKLKKVEATLFTCLCPKKEIDTFAQPQTE